MSKANYVVLEFGVKKKAFEIILAYKKKKLLAIKRIEMCCEHLTCDIRFAIHLPFSLSIDVHDRYSHFSTLFCMRRYL